MRIEQKLRRKDISHLPPALQKERLRNLAVLREYWSQETFPKNTQYPGQRLPHIRDAEGTLCAMAYLIEKSGHHKLVDQLAEANNLVYIDDVKEGPLIEWLRMSGLGQDEAAEIQPTYGGGWDSGGGEIVHYPSFFGSFNASVVIPFMIMLIVIEVIGIKVITSMNISSKTGRIAAHVALFAVATGTSFSIIALFQLLS